MTKIKAIETALNVMVQAQTHRDSNWYEDDYEESEALITLCTRKTGGRLQYLDYHLMTTRENLRRSQPDTFSPTAHVRMLKTKQRLLHKIDEVLRYGDSIFSFV
jgi:hypothetical protein